jgi:hypothetical protein
MYEMEHHDAHQIRYLDIDSLSTNGTSLSHMTNEITFSLILKNNK